MCRSRKLEKKIKVKECIQNGNKNTPTYLVGGGKENKIKVKSLGV
jgi:hypothetical protein